MKQISWFDLYFLIKEFKVLENNRIDTFFYHDETFFMKIYVKNIGNRYLICKPGKYLYLGDEKDESNFPSSFVQHLRKYLKNGFVVQIKQTEGERVIDIEIDKKEEDKIAKYHILLEIFANGNVILTDENYKIMNSLQKKKFKDRKIMVKEIYELPPQKELSFFNLKLEDFEKKIKESGLSIVKYLALKFGIGGKYAEEICFLSGIEKDRKDLTNLEIEKIIENINILINNVNTELKPYGIYKNEDLEDFIPFNFKSISENENISKKEFNNYNELIKTYFTSFKETIDEKEKQFQKELDKLQNRLEKQLEQQKEIEIDSEKYNELGNKIYEHYQLVENLLNSINSSAKEKGWTHVLKTIEEKPELKKLIKKLNYKNNEIILELE